MWLKSKMFLFCFTKNLKSSFSTWLTHLTLRFLYFFGCSGPRCAMPFQLEKQFWVQVQLWEKIKSTFFSIIIQISYDKISLTHCIFLNKSHWGKFGLPCESDIFFMCARCCVQWHFTGTYFPDLYGPCVSLGFYILVDPVGTPPPHSGTYSCEKQQQ